VSTVNPRTSSARNEVRQAAPGLVELGETVLYADVRERPGSAMTTGSIARKVFEETKS
jgi:hypothetical protein